MHNNQAELTNQMKPYLKLIIIYLLSLLATILLLRLLADWLLNRTLDAPIWVTSIVWIVLYSMIYWGGLIKRFKPQLDYIQKADAEPPKFESVITRRLEVKGTGFSMDQLLKALEKSYEITFINQEQRVIKLHDRFSMSSWGACTFIRYQEKEGIIYLASYPLTNLTFPLESAGRRQNKAIAEVIQGMSTEQ
jgi:hypothetical protein